MCRLSWNLEASSSWNPQGLSGPVTSLLFYLYLDWVGGQRHVPDVLPPGKTPYPLYRRVGGPQGRSVRVRKISPPIGSRSPDRPARSESLYGLSHSGPLYIYIYIHTHTYIHTYKTAKTRQTFCGFLKSGFQHGPNLLRQLHREDGSGFNNSWDWRKVTFEILPPENWPQNPKDR